MDVGAASSLSASCRACRCFRRCGELCGALFWAGCCCVTGLDSAVTRWCPAGELAPFVRSEPTGCLSGKGTEVTFNVSPSAVLTRTSAAAESRRSPREGSPQCRRQARTRALVTKMRASISSTSSRDVLSIPVSSSCSDDDEVNACLACSRFRCERFSLRVRAEICVPMIRMSFLSSPTRSRTT